MQENSISLKDFGKGPSALEIRQIRQFLDKPLFDETPQEVFTRKSTGKSVRASRITLTKMSQKKKYGLTLVNGDWVVQEGKKRERHSQRSFELLFAEPYAGAKEGDLSQDITAEKVLDSSLPVLSPSPGATGTSSL